MWKPTGNMEVHFLPSQLSLVTSPSQTAIPSLCDFSAHRTENTQVAVYGTIAIVAVQHSAQPRALFAYRFFTSIAQLLANCLEFRVPPLSDRPPQNL